MDDGRTAESGSGNAHLGGQGSGSGQMNGATVDTHNVMDDGRKGRRSGGGHVPDEVVAELMEQIIRFSKMYWKSVNPRSEERRVGKECKSGRWWEVYRE